ncbi:bifunctional DNA-formamidopyrimidine glycosylase/DNA-(apurinic or apyrimidinic site) lyase [Corallincola luteus]|uniref:Formamidopyrimidine-DNA glycosylase n=1 Tax=Corallincola luteus TaxID=1775177 RepID=A0ABY2ANC7_9GAMM|nr:bifunctional DNA-formamidopyrimidine glycosylase/DNA-(apurinic or apyrimidinic site) lyase [Corallincola luteus]TCI04152.1 bifunctional DNA-formamidopyrimidine glycosylase/DNA-(apurinic or apyrimidinic site) lyase [Corallincola luteus]
MPELPEVEVSRQGITPFLTGKQITRVEVRDKRLRWPVPDEVNQLEGQTIIAVRRRAKYLLIDTAIGSAILHLGMSGRLRVIDSTTVADKHDHIQIHLCSGKMLRLTDPRRFGAFLWGGATPLAHPLLSKLGPEPLTKQFDANVLYGRSRGRKSAVKTFIMDNHNVVGVGNIYANEALFAARINPKTAAGKISLARYQLLTEEIKSVLARAIQQGGTTLKDFAQSDGKPGYFVQELKVYGKGGQPCPNCGAELKEIKLGQRSTVYCAICQR